jgi:hydrogenase maturation protease
MRRLVIGLGNPWRRDDGAGLAVARILKERGGQALSVVEVRDDLTALIPLLQEAERVVVVDAASSGARPGTIHRLKADQLQYQPRVSSHGVTLSEVLKLATTLGAKPSRVTIYCIEGRDFGQGEGLSKEVREAVGRLAARILKELGA